MRGKSIPGSRIIAVLLSFFIFFSPTLAVAQETKQSLVLMPVKGKGVEMSPLELSIYRSALAEELSIKYDVYTGTEVDSKIFEIFEKESRESLDCDEAKCYQDIAIAFQTELIATAMVLPKRDQYLVKLEINNVFSNKVVFASSDSCEKCSETEVIVLLKKMAKKAGGRKVETVAKVEKEKVKEQEIKKEKKSSNWWLWTLLGVAVIGAGAAFALEDGGDDDNGGGGGGGGGGGASPSTVTVTW